MRTCSVAVLVAAALASVRFPCGAQVDTAARTPTGISAAQTFGGRRLEAELAYRLVHISNGNMAGENPGLNFHQLAVGAGFRPRKR